MSMKTLDEVIKAYEICLNINETSCHDCPYTEFNAEGKWACSLCGDCTEDALHYLKVLKDILDPLKIRKVSHEIICPQCNSAIAILLPESNEPLTWDELKAMKGKPIWVEDNIDGPEKSIKCWAICRGIKKTQKTEYALLCDFYYDKAEYGKTWQAYKREKEKNNE